jgi:hypothetical protein
MDYNRGDERPRKRAKLACTICNARRVKCDVTDRQPCRNCEVAQAVCETRESKRGKHPRKPKGDSNHDKRNSAAASEYVLGSLQIDSALTASGSKFTWPLPKGTRMTLPRPTC